MYLVFDIGATHLRIGVSVDGTTIAKQATVHTPEKFEEGLSTIVRLAGELRDGQIITAASGASAGVVDAATGTLITAPNLPGWVGHSVREALATTWQVPVGLHNDAALAGLAEATIGAGKGSRIVAYITVSTGIGGARIVDGKIDVATYGFEPGQHLIDLDSSACAACRQPGILEHYASGSGLHYRYHRKPEEITDATVWHDVIRYLAVGLHNLTMFWSPEVIVLGGALILKQRIALSELQTEFAKVSHIFPTLPTLKIAELGSDNGLLGALARMQTT